MSRLLLAITLFLALAPAEADSVFVSTQPAGNIPGYPSQYLLKTKPGATDVVSVCDSASIPIGRADMNNCSSARRWVTVSTVKATDKIGYCYGTAATVPACDIASGGGEGWQLASAIWAFTPQPPVVTGSKKVHLKAVLTNTDNSVITAAEFAGYRVYFGNTASALDQMVELRTSQLDLVYDVPLAQGSWFLGATEFLNNGAESAKSSPLLTATISGTPPPPPGCIAPRPTDKIRSGTCPAGTIGAWQQTMAYECVSGAWMESGDWEPVTPPAGVCTAVPPPTLVLKTTGGDVLIASTDYANWDRWKTGAKAGVVSPGQKCEPARQIKGTELYRVSTGITWTAGTKTYVVAACRLQ